VPTEAVANIRDDMYISEAIRFLDKNPDAKLGDESKANLKVFNKQMDDATKFIPLWVNVSVAIALGLGTGRDARGASSLLRCPGRRAIATMPAADALADLHFEGDTALAPSLSGVARAPVPASIASSLIVSGGCTRCAARSTR
jgi:hypothetical protein